MAAQGIVRFPDRLGSGDEKLDSLLAVVDDAGKNLGVVDDAAWKRAVIAMDLVQSPFVTDDVAQLAEFNGRLVGTAVISKDYYVEVPTGGLSVAFSKCRFTEIGSTCACASERAPCAGESILDFRSEDVDRAYARIDRIGVEWVLPPTTQPWGERAMTFRDPQGHLVNICSRVGQSSGRR